MRTITPSISTHSSLQPAIDPRWNSHFSPPNIYKMKVKEATHHNSQGGFFPGCVTDTSKTGDAHPAPIILSKKQYMI